MNALWPRTREGGKGRDSTLKSIQSTGSKRNSSTACTTAARNKREDPHSDDDDDDDDDEMLDQNPDVTLPPPLCAHAAPLRN
jgi:hypothetical protein